MKGSDLRCECGTGAIDVAPNVEIRGDMAVSWRCVNRHINITGARPGYEGIQQARYLMPGEAPTRMGPVEP